MFFLLNLTNNFMFISFEIWILLVYKKSCLKKKYLMT